MKKVIWGLVLCVVSCGLLVAFGAFLGRPGPVPDGIGVLLFVSFFGFLGGVSLITGSIAEPCTKLANQEIYETVAIGAHKNKYAAILRKSYGDLLFCVLDVKPPDGIFRVRRDGKYELIDSSTSFMSL